MVERVSSPIPRVQAIAMSKSCWKPIPFKDRLTHPSDDASKLLKDLLNRHNTGPSLRCRERHHRWDL